MLSFHFEHKYSGNVKSFVSPEPWALHLGGAFFMKKKRGGGVAQLHNTDFQGSMALLRKAILA